MLCLFKVKESVWLNSRHHIKKVRFGTGSTLNSNISAPCRATGKFWYSTERSAPAHSETPRTFSPTIILRTAMTFQSKVKFFCGHPVRKYLMEPGSEGFNNKSFPHKHHNILSPFLWNFMKIDIHLKVYQKCTHTDIKFWSQYFGRYKLFMHMMIWNAQNY